MKKELYCYIGARVISGTSHFRISRRKKFMPKSNETFQHHGSVYREKAVYIAVPIVRILILPKAPCSGG